MFAPVWWKESKERESQRVVTLEEEKIVRWMIDDKEDWRKEEEIKEDYKKIEEIVPKRFWSREKYLGK